MEKERRFKTIGLIAVIVAIIGLSVAFAALSQTLTINGTGKVASSTWSVVWEEIDNQTIVPSEGVTVQSGYPKLDTVSLVKDNNAQLTGTTLDLGQITLHKPGDNATFRINIANVGDIDAMVTGVTGVSVNNTYVSYSVKYLDNEEVSNALNGRLLAAGDRKLVTIEVKFKEDVTTEQYNQIPQNGVTVDLNGVTITYSQNDGTGTADTTTTTTTQAQQQGYSFTLNDISSYWGTANNNYGYKISASDFWSLIGSSDLSGTEYVNGMWLAFQTNDSNFIGINDLSTLHDDSSSLPIYIGAYILENYVYIFPCYSNGEGYEFGENGNITYEQMIEDYGNVTITLVNASNMSGA